MTLIHQKQKMMTDPKHITDLFHNKNYTKAMDLRGEPTEVCVCGCDVFHMLAGFVEGKIAFYFIDAECASCGSMLTLPTPTEEEEKYE